MYFICVFILLAGPVQCFAVLDYAYECAGRFKKVNSMVAGHDKLVNG